MVTLKSAERLTVVVMVVESLVLSVSGWVLVIAAVLLRTAPYASELGTGTVNCMVAVVLLAKPPLMVHTLVPVL